MRWAGYVARKENRRGAYRVLVRRPKGNRPLGRPMHRWEVAVIMDLKEVGREAWTGLIWIGIQTGGMLL